MTWNNFVMAFSRSLSLIFVSYLLKIKLLCFLLNCYDIYIINFMIEVFFKFAIHLLFKFGICVFVISKIAKQFNVNKLMFYFLFRFRY